MGGPSRPDFSRLEAAPTKFSTLTLSLSSFLYISIAMSVFFMLQAVDDVYDMDFLDATLLSVYFQVIVLLSIGHVLRSQRVEDMNFDVYKEKGKVAAE